MTTNLDYSTISIEKLIVHDVPRHSKGDLSIQPNYSENESELSDGLRVFFKDKIIGALLNNKALRISYNPSNSSPISWIMKETLTNNSEDIINKSTQVARHLFEIQVGSNTAGILVFIFGKVNSQNTCILLKLERDKGAQLKLNPITKAYDINEIENLMLTQKTKIFKVALFIDSPKGQYDGIIMDYQIDIRKKKEANSWFIDNFLGCKPFEDPKIITQHFYNFTREFINSIDDEIEKVKFIQDLNSYVKKNTPLINPEEFAKDYLTTTQHRNDYKAFLESKDFEFSPFIKDLVQIESMIKKLTVSFANGISIIGNKGTFEENVTLEDIEEGKHKATITSKINSIK